MGRKLPLSRTLRYENRANWLFVAPQFILYFTFVLLPFLASIPFAFTDYVNFADADARFSAFENFVAIFTHPALKQWVWPSVFRTILFMVMNYATVFLFGMTLALFMYELSSRTTKRFFILIYLPYIISGLGVGMFIGLLFARDTGSLNVLFQHLGVIDRPINIKSSSLSLVMLVLFVGWRYAGYNMALFLSGLLTIPGETIDASKIDGANYVQRLLHVYIPQIRPAIAIATISCLVGSFGIFDEAVGFGALSGNDQARLFSITLFRMGMGTSGKMSEGIAASIVVFTPLTVVAFLIFRSQMRQRLAQG